MAYKLIKVAKTFNVGLHTIVETLHSQGFTSVEEKPNADVSDEMYALLQKEFQKEMAIKQEADKLLRPSAPKKEMPAPAATVLPSPKVNGPAEMAPVEPRQVTPPPPPAEEGVKPVAPPSDPEPAQREPQHRAPGLKVLGKIDLNPPKAAPRPPTPPPVKNTPAPEPKPAEERRPEVPKEERRPEQKKPEAPVPATPVQPALPKPEAKTAEPASPPKSTPPVETPVTPTVPADTKPAEPEMYRADSPQLRGLKVLGRINLDEQKKSDPRGGGNKRDDRNRQRGGGQQGSGNPQNANRSGSGPNPQGQNRGGGPNPQGQNRGSGPNPQGQNRGGGPNQQGQNRGSGPNPQGPNRGTPNTPATATGGTGTTSASDLEKRKRKRKKVQQPVTADALQKSMTANQGDKRGTARRDEPQAVSQKEIEDKIRQTIARMGAGASRKRQKIRRDKRDVMREKAELAEQALIDGGKKLQVTEFISVSDLASLMSVKPADVIKACMTLGIFVSINQRLDAEIIEVVSSEFGYEVQFISAEEQVEVEEEEADLEADLRPRQPIVTVMGHVDHGKTSLLDFIRSANVASGEAGGITQHIGAYEVVTEDGRKVTFLDTPGHEAFTAMRARGAKVTDIAVIVIAADDNIMPQTKEAISHAQAAGVPLVFAINKIDKAGADPERIKGELAQMNLLVEDWGGKYQSQDISAKTGLNIDKLLEKVLLEAEILDLKANPDRRAIGTVLEASLDKGRGYVTKILVENGTLHDGDPLISGEFAGRVKAMFNERGQKVKEAGPAAPVLVLGLPGAPQAGEKIKVAASEAEAKEIAAKRGQIIREQATRATKRISLDEIGRRLALGSFKELNLIVKGDVDGSVEALSDSLIKLSVENIQVNVIHKAVGQIVDSDVMLASASDAIIIGFQVRPSLSARKLAEKEGVEIKTYSIIYEAIGEIKLAMEGLLEPTKEEEIMGQVEVREVYKISKIGTVAGCIVQEGKISRNYFIRIVRDGIIVYPVNEGQTVELASLKRFKEDAKEVRAGLECGLTVKNFNDIKVGDIIESFIIKEVKATL